MAKKKKGQIQGGFKESFEIRLGWWIREALRDRHETWGEQLYHQYKAAVAAIPLKRRPIRGRPAALKRKVISYEGFRTYIYLLTRIGLIEYVDVRGKATIPETKGHSGPAPHLLRRNFFRIVPGRFSDPGWDNPWEHYKDYPRKE